MRVRSRAMAIIIGATAVAVAAPAAAADKPCGKIDFRPLNQGMPDGEHIAGLYNSKSGKIELMGQMKNGQAQNYWLSIKNKPMEAAAAVPKGADSCLKQFHVKLPYETQAKGACTGNKFRIVIDNKSGGKKTLMLFGLHGDDWKFCQAGTL